MSRAARPPEPAQTVKNIISKSPQERLNRTEILEELTTDYSETEVMDALRALYQEGEISFSSKWEIYIEE